MKRDILSTRHCPLARAGSQLVDGWTLVLLREVMLGNNRFDGLQEQSGMSPRSLTLRLKALVTAEILQKHAYQERPQRFEYQLTEKGLDLWPVIVTVKQWGDKWLGPWTETGATDRTLDEPPMKLMHRGHDHEIVPQLSCRTCEEPVSVFSGLPVLSEKMIAERQEMARLHAEKKTKSAK